LNTVAIGLRSDYMWENVTNLKIEDLVDFEALLFKVVDFKGSSPLCDNV